MNDLIRAQLESLYYQAIAIYAMSDDDTQREYARLLWESNTNDNLQVAYSRGIEQLDQMLAFCENQAIGFILATLGAGI